jgi:protein ImuA
MSTLPDSPALPAQVWRAASLGRAEQPGLPSGHAALDALLPGGGWPRGALTELLQPQAGLAEWRLLAPALARQAQAPLLLINPPLQPHAPGLHALGLDPAQLVWLQPATPQQALWATEQAIRSQAAAALLAWLPQARPEQLRRLQAAAQGSAAPLFICRPAAAQAQSSPAPLRVLLQPGPQWQLQLRLIKRRGPAHEDWLRLEALPAALAGRLSARQLQALPPRHHEEGPHPTPARPSRPAPLSPESWHESASALARIAARRLPA